MNDQPVQREPRTSLMVRVVIHRDTPGGPIERRVRNLSASGACIDHAHEIVEDGCYLVEIGCAAPVLADIVWLSDKLAGLRFRAPIDLADARRPRATAIVPRAGWLGEMRDAHR